MNCKSRRNEKLESAQRSSYFTYRDPIVFANEGPVIGIHIWALIGLRITK
jgi:hypothetical protein